MFKQMFTEDEIKALVPVPPIPEMPHLWIGTVNRSFTIESNNIVITGIFFTSELPSNDIKGNISKLINDYWKSKYNLYENYPLICLNGNKFQISNWTIKPLNLVTYWDTNTNNLTGLLTYADAEGVIKSTTVNLEGSTSNNFWNKIF